MKLNIIKLQKILLNISNVGLTHQREWDSDYTHLSNMKVHEFCTTCNYAVWTGLLHAHDNLGDALDRHELALVFDTLPADDVETIFKKINVRSKCITQDEFDDFLLRLDETDYVNIAMCLESNEDHEEDHKEDHEEDHKEDHKEDHEEDHEEDHKIKPKGFFARYCCCLFGIKA